MTTYKVTWEIDLEADSIEDAARQARAYQLDGGAQVGYFTVAYKVGLHTISRDIDLDELGAAQ